jgi:hypothetical protein
MVRLQEAYLAPFQRAAHSSVDIICPPESLYVLSPSRFIVIQTTSPIRIGKFLADVLVQDLPDPPLLKSMEMLNFFLISPKSGKCEITLAH